MIIRGIREEANRTQKPEQNWAEQILRDAEIVTGRQIREVRARSTDDARPREWSYTDMAPNADDDLGDERIRDDEFARVNGIA